jgi:hypothetical protein
MTYYLNSERVRDIRARYGVALRVVDGVEYREVFELPGPEDWGGDMTHAEWLDGFSTIDYPVPAGPQTYESWLLGPTVMYPEVDPLAEEIYQEIVAEHGDHCSVPHPPIWPHYIDRSMR